MAGVRLARISFPFVVHHQAHNLRQFRPEIHEVAGQDQFASAVVRPRTWCWPWRVTRLLQHSMSSSKHRWMSEAVEKHPHCAELWLAHARAHLCQNERDKLQR